MSYSQHFTEQIISQILSALKENAAIMGEMTAEMRSISSQTANLKIEKDKLYNATYNLELKIALLQESVSDLEKDLKEFHQTMSQAEAQEREAQQSYKNNRVLIIIAILGILGTVIGAGIAIFPSFLK